jgi:hypothetical protein
MHPIKSNFVDNFYTRCVLIFDFFFGICRLPLEILLVEDERTDLGIFTWSRARPTHDARRLSFSFVHLRTRQKLRIRVTSFLCDSTNGMKSATCDVTARPLFPRRLPTMEANKGLWFGPTNGINNAVGQDV